MRVASRSPDEHLRVHITDGQGHWIRIAVVGPNRRVRFEVAEPGGMVLVRGDLDSGFESQLNLLREHGTDAKVGIAGRFHVEAVDQSDKAGYVDWRERRRDGMDLPQPQGSQDGLGSIPDQ